jgi:hypothetical protein
MALKGTLDALASADAEAFTRLRAAESIGRPLGDDRFLAKIERHQAPPHATQTWTEAKDPNGCEWQIIALSP